MPIDILMPALSPTMTEGNLAKWHVKEGDAVKSGKVIAEIETDKATMEVEAVDEGIVGKILIPAGTEGVKVNAAIAVLLADGEDKKVLEKYLVVSSQKSVASNDGASLKTENRPQETTAQAAVIPAGVMEILMPALSPTMTEGNLAKWHVKEGDAVKSGKVIAEIETDKATMEVEAVDEGIVGKILIPAGTPNVKVNAAIALLVAEGKDANIVEGYKPAVAGSQLSVVSEVTAPKAPVATPQAAPTLAPQASKAPAITNTGNRQLKTGNSRLNASPLARTIAANSNVDISQIIGTGPKGRIIKADVEEFIARGGSSGGVLRRNPNEFEHHPNTTMRKVIAKRLLESKQQVPHFYLSVDCTLDALLEVRAQLNDKAARKAGKGGTPAYKLSVNDLIIKAVAMGMLDVPAANASWYDDAIVRYTNVDVSVAVAIEGGLVTPVIRNADQKTLPQISNEMKELAAKARAGKLTPQEMTGGGFSISNLGMFGIKTFSAIINPPQSCILAVGAGEERVVVKNGTMEVANVMTVTLSVDHRSVDGAVGAEFLQAFKEYIESPALLLV